VANRKLMWQAYLKLKTYHEKPSATLEISDTIVAWCVDSTVLWFGITVENALLERVNTGTEKEAKWEAKYTLEELLDPLFRMPRPLPQPKRMPQEQNPWAPLLALAGKPGSGVKWYRYVGPEAKPS
jgi:hypothetical protein